MTAIRVLVTTGETHHYDLSARADRRGDWSWSDDGRRLVIRPGGAEASRVEYPLGSVVKVDVIKQGEAA